MQAKRVTISVDANGADLGPAEVAAGASLAAAQGGMRVLLFGPAGEIGDIAGNVEVVDSPVSVAKAADPARAVRANPDASIVRAARAVAAGEADAVVSGGSTGSLVAAGLFNVKRASGVHRPALAVPLPIPGAPVLFLDVGANAQARPEYLVQFAFMGAAFARAVLGVGEPRVALLANGEESTRGTPDVLAAHEQLARIAREAGDGPGGIDFVGNVEGTGLLAGAADVVVTDGFTGNVALKVMEATSASVMVAVRQIATASKTGAIGGVLLRPSLRRFRDEIDPELGGGAYLLGLRRHAVVCHGRFTRRGFANAILSAERGVRERVVEKTRASLEAAGALRAPPPAATSEPAASVPGP
jgi:glycerol-3-phosphate acyltransferase PlsX